MNARIFPTNSLQGEVTLPASKSYSIRAFLVAACGGQSRIIRPSLCDDALAAASVARKLGAQVNRGEDNVWEIAAGAGREQLQAINVKESGTVLRILLPLVALRNKSAAVTGEGTLKGRPNAHLVEALQRRGISVRGVGSVHSVPIRFDGGKFRGGDIQIDGSLSSQFVSALLMACPQVPEDSCVTVTGGKQVSVDYITMTIQILRKAGVVIKKKGKCAYQIAGGQRFRGLKNFYVPSDYGLAAFLMAAAALIESNVRLNGYLNDEFVQADAAILPFLRKMGVRFRKTTRSLSIQGPFVLKGQTFSLKDCPDLLPIMAVLALFAKGRSRFLDIAHVRVKESDRIADLCCELRKVGARVDESKDQMTIYPLKQKEVRSDVILDPHHDHRLAMAFSVLGLKTGLSVKDVECVSKSYPGFLTDLRSLGASLKTY